MAEGEKRQRVMKSRECSLAKGDACHSREIRYNFRVLSRTDNSRPSIPAGQTRSVAEGSPRGTVVGISLTCEDEEASIESVNADIAKRAAGAEAFTTLREGAQLRLFSDGLVCVVVGHVMKKAGSQQYYQTPDQPVFSFPLPMIRDVGMCEGSSFDVRTVDGQMYARLETELMAWTGEFGGAPCKADAKVN